MLAALYTAAARGDRVVLRDGRVLDGNIVRQDDSILTIRIEAPGSTLTQRIDRSQIKSITRTADERPAYIAVPVIGRIGTEVTADALREGLELALQSNPRCVVLAIDSSGGSIGETLGMIRCIAETSHRAQIIAFVKKAHNSAALLALGCPRLFMTPSASIGADLPVAWGRIFLLNSDQASVWGIAQSAFSLPDLGRHLSVGQRWDEGSRRAWNKVESYAAEARYRRQQQLEQQQRLRDQQIATAQIKSECDAIEQRLAKLRSRAQAADRQIQHLRAAHEAQSEKINIDYQRALDLAKLQSDPAEAAACAVEVADVRRTAARQFLQAEIERLESDRDTARVEADRLHARQQQLMASNSAP